MLSFRSLSATFVSLIAATSLQVQAQNITVGTGEAKVGMLLQAWAVNDSTAENYQYRIRRAEFKLSGSVVEKTRYFLMIDPAKSLKTGAVAQTNDNKVLQDLGVAFTLAEGLELIVGQYKTPTTAEGLDPSAELLFPERAYVARAYGDKREPGISLSYKKDWLKATVMSSNGQGTNVDDTTVTNEKDLHARVELTPFENFNFGAFTTAGDASYDDKARWGANVRYTVAGFLVRLEGVRAKDPAGWSTGYVGDLAYSVNDKLQPAVRYEGFDNGNFVATQTTIGLNYFLSKHNAKIMAAYGLLDNMVGNNGAGAVGSYQPSNGTDGSLFIMNFQMAL